MSKLTTKQIVLILAGLVSYAMAFAAIYDLSSVWVRIPVGMLGGAILGVTFAFLVASGRGHSLTTKQIVLVMAGSMCYGLAFAASQELSHAWARILVSMSGSAIFSVALAIVVASSRTDP